MFETIKTQYGELYLEDSLGEAYVYPSDDFLERVLYDYVSENEALMEACEEYHLEQEPLLSLDQDDYHYSTEGILVEARNILENDFDIPLIED